jgi:hypothetical protein
MGMRGFSVLTASHSLALGRETFQAHCAKGFCVFNNAAVAAAVARKRLGVQRVLIVDWDGAIDNTSPLPPFRLALLSTREKSSLDFDIALSAEPSPLVLCLDSAPRQWHPAHVRRRPDRAVLQRPPARPRRLLPLQPRRLARKRNGSIRCPMRQSTDPLVISLIVCSYALRFVHTSPLGRLGSEMDKALT